MRDGDVMGIVVKNLNKSFNGKNVINNFSATFTEDKITCIMGKSGSGKTTLLNIFASLIEPDNAEILDISESVSYVFQENRLCENFSALTNVKITLNNKKITDEDIKENFRMVGIDDAYSKPVSSFSGGMKRRVAIVRAVLADSKVLLLDEPFSGLDDITKKKVIEYIINGSKNRTVIITTHDISDIDQFSANLINLV